MEKIFTPAAIEQKYSKIWEEKGLYAPSGAGEKSFTIMIPPPNVTGSLHMGHALNNILQDILIRYHRMKGDDTLWQPGTDHAGIATQMVVERQLAAEGKSRVELGREAFTSRVWQWKGESGGIISGQLRRLGASCDWANERFTLDEGLSQAVTKVFVDLYQKGLIYRDKRLVNWDPKLLTAISDLEVESRPSKGNLWHLRYPLKDNPEQYIVVATTRPETMMGDVAVAVHPEDERYKHLIGTMVRLPLANRDIPIIADDWADPNTGSGAVKITPAHDFNDFNVGKRHHLPMMSIMDIHGHLNNEVPEAYRGLERFEARKKIVAEFEALGLLEKIEPHQHALPYGDRSGVIIEPLLTDQWYVDAATLAKPAIKAVEDGDMVFVPKNWEKTYFEWMRNIQPWCISRQLWWGHRIPAWYDEQGHVYVANNEAEALAQATAKHGGATVTLRRDEDVLDTWFSSGLWPFSTLGWPENTQRLQRYFPTSILITGFDIIFFWVARMMMMSLFTTGQVPFSTVYVHALVRDEKGQKMSKSKGNVIDPLELIDQYGADALRFTLAAMAGQGRDIKLATSRVEGYRNFATKLWNAARFCLMNEAKPVADFKPEQLRHHVNRWFYHQLQQVVVTVEEKINSYHFNEAAGAAYQFSWGIFCDWYLEMAKPLLNGAEAAETRGLIAYALDVQLRLLHPFMPFITEEIFQQLHEGKQGWLITANWPNPPAIASFADAVQEVEWVVQIINHIRSARMDVGVSPAQKLPLLVRDLSPTQQGWLAQHSALIEKLARVENPIVHEGAFPKGCITAVMEGGISLALPVANIIDIDAERQRLQKELAKTEADIQKIVQKLSNPQFTEKAPPEVVEENEERKNDALNVKAKIEAALKSLAA
ncbi:MAG: valine--tRNA ligase [Alphaproteobacteria bacterium]